MPFRNNIILVLIAMILVGCGRQAPLRNLDDICSIFDKRPGWYASVLQSEQKWGAPAAVQMAIMWRESRFKANAAPPKKYVLGLIPWGRRSTAYGYAQALDGTWDWYRKDTGNSGADRSLFEDAIDFIGWYTSRTHRVNELKYTDAYHQYLAYHQGHAGFKRGRWKQNTRIKKAARQVEAMSKKYASQIGDCSG